MCINIRATSLRLPFKGRFQPSACVSWSDQTERIHRWPNTRSILTCMMFKSWATSSTQTLQSLAAVETIFPWWQKWCWIAATEACFRTRPRFKMLTQMAVWSHPTGWGLLKRMRITSSRALISRCLASSKVIHAALKTLSLSEWSKTTLQTPQSRAKTTQGLCHAAPLTISQEVSWSALSP